MGDLLFFYAHLQLNITSSLLHETTMHADLINGQSNLYCFKEVIHMEERLNWVINDYESIKEKEGYDVGLDALKKGYANKLACVAKNRGYLENELFGELTMRGFGFKEISLVLREFDCLN